VASRTLERRHETRSPKYSYDANGNAITRQGSTISWSSYNYPTTINAGSGSTAETVAFSYDPNRQRWQQMYTGNGSQETTNYIGGLLEVVASGSATDYRHYVNVAGEQIGVYSRKSSGVNTFSYLLSDHQASVASITNSSGAQVVGESFDAFGNRRNPSSWSGPPSNSDLTTIAGITREGYTFQTALGLWMGMNHMNGRVEDAVTGRMLSADPHIPDRSNTQSYNRFSYVNNNPLTLSDPTGFSPCWTCKPIDGGPDFTGGVSAGMYADMLSSGSFGSYQALGAAYNAANGLSGLGVSAPASNGQQQSGCTAALNCILAPPPTGQGQTGQGQTGSTSNSSNSASPPSSGPLSDKWLAQQFPTIFSSGDPLSSGFQPGGAVGDSLGGQTTQTDQFGAPNAFLLGAAAGTVVVGYGVWSTVYVPILGTEATLDALAGVMSSAAVGSGYGGPIGGAITLGLYESYIHYPPPGTCSGLGCPAGMSPY
jgi:RHS repeat-associated protein